MIEEPKDQQITLVDEDGNEILYDVLFTFKSDDFDRSYILMFPAAEENDQDVNIEAFALPKDDDPTNPKGGDLQPIESDEEWDMVQEMLNTFLDPNSDL